MLIPGEEVLAILDEDEPGLLAGMAKGWYPRPVKEWLNTNPDAAGKPVWKHAPLWSRLAVEQHLVALRSRTIHGRDHGR